MFNAVDFRKVNTGNIYRIYIFRLILSAICCTALLIYQLTFCLFGFQKLTLSYFLESQRF